LPELSTNHPELPAPPPLLDRWQQKRFFEAIGYAFTGSALPFVLVLDDLQWCDTETLEWLPYFLSSVAQERLFVVATVRPEEVDQNHPLHALWRTLLREEQLTTIPLGALSAPETAELAATVVQHELSEHVAARLHQETAGSPLFIVEQMRTRGLPTVEVGENSGAHRDLPQLFGRAEEGNVALPPKVVAVLQARLAHLSVPTYALAQVAACTGRAFNVELLAEASLWDEEAVVNAVDELWQRHVIQEVGAAIYDFSHEHIRTVAYDALSPVRRRFLHHRIAQALARRHASDLSPVAGELGFHYERAGLLEQAVDAYHQAADASRQLYAYNEVAGYLERSLAVLDSMPTSPRLAKTKIDLLHELGVARIRSVGWGSASVGEAWQQAHDLAQQAGTPFQQCRAMHALDYYQRHRGQWQHACEQSTAALALAQAQALDDPFLLQNLLGSRGGALYHTGAPAQALAALEQAIIFSAQPIQPSYDWYASHPQLMALLRSAHCLWLLGFADQARTRAQEAVEEAQKSDDQRQAGFTPRLYRLDFSAMLAYSLRDVAQVQALGGELIELGSRIDVAFYLRTGQMYVGWALAQQGDVAVGLHLLRESVKSHRADNIRKFEPTWRAMLAEVLALAGDVAQALQEVDETLAYTAESANCYWDAHLLMQKADFLHALDAPAAEVEHWYQQALSVASQQGARALELRVVVNLSRLWQQQGQSRAAYQQLAAIIESFTEGLDTPDLRQAKALLDQLYSRQ
jgi:predicted ATPase